MTDELKAPFCGAGNPNTASEPLDVKADQGRPVRAHASGGGITVTGVDAFALDGKLRSITWPVKGREKENLVDWLNADNRSPQHRGRSAARAHILALTEQIAEMTRDRDALRITLTQALGLIVEFGDLNGFRNLSDQELGEAVIAVAEECVAALASGDKQ